MLIDELSPLSVGSERIALAPADPLTPARAFSPFSVAVDYALCDPEGVVLPLEMVVTSPSKSTRTLFRRVVPTELTIHPDEGGPWIVVLREHAHNLWWGRLAIDVDGDRLGG